MKKALKVLCIIGLSFIAAPFYASAAIHYDTSADLGNTSGTTLTASYTATSTNPLLLVYIHGSTDTDNITSVTANGVAMTRIENPVFQGRYDYLYYVTGVSGTFNIVITNNGSGDTYIGALASSYAGVDQSGPESTNSVTANSSTVAVPISTTANGSWQMGVFGGLGYTLNSITNGTFRQPTTSNDNHTFDSNGPLTPAGTITFTGNYASSANHYGIVASFAPASGSSGINGSGTANRYAKFLSLSTIGNALLSDDGANISITSGNLFLQAGAAIDSAVAGMLNLGTATATSITIGHGSATTTISGPLSAANATFSTIKTTSNCNSTTSPASCGSANAGSVAIAAGDSTLTVNTTSVTASSQIFLTEDSSLGSRLGVTCNTTSGRNYSVTSRTAGTSFTIKSSGDIATNKACINYFIVN